MCGVTAAGTAAAAGAAGETAGGETGAGAGEGGFGSGGGFGGEAGGDGGSGGGGGGDARGRRRRRSGRGRGRQVPSGRSAGEVLHPVDPVRAADRNAHAGRAERRVFEIGAMARGGEPGGHHVGGRCWPAAMFSPSDAAPAYPQFSIRSRDRARWAGPGRHARSTRSWPCGGPSDGRVRERRIDAQRRQAERRAVLVDERDDLRANEASDPGQAPRRAGTPSLRARCDERSAGTAAATTAAAIAAATKTRTPGTRRRYAVSDFGQRAPRIRP